MYVKQSQGHSKQSSLQPISNTVDPAYCHTLLALISYDNKQDILLSGVVSMQYSGFGLQSLMTMSGIFYQTI